jgi:hypothetical protein
MRIYALAGYRRTETARPLFLVILTADWRTF